MLVDISDSDARIRANIMLAPDAAISFRWMGPSRTAIVVHGHVSDVAMVDKRTAEYTIDFNMPSRTRDVLAHELLEMQRRKLMKIEEPLRLVEDDEVGGVARRKAYRALVQFPVRVRAWRRGRWAMFEGEARDLSVGGMMLLLPDEVEEGSELELMFTLPSDGYAAPAKTTEVVEITPFGERRVKKSSSTRAPEEVKVRARVHKQLGNARNGAPLFGVGFVEMAGVYHEEIARWVHGHQLSQLRKGPGTPRRVAPTVTRFYRQERPAARRRHIDTARTVLFRAIGERHFGPPTFARDRRELIAMPAHVAAPSVGSEDDVFGFGDQEKPKPATVERIKPRECYVVGDEDVFGLGARQEAS